MTLILMKLYKHVDNIHHQGTVSQMFYYGLSFDFILKKGKLFVIFTTVFSTFHKTKTRT